MISLKPSPAQSRTSLSSKSPGSYIEDKRTGETTTLHKRRGVYVMDIKVRRSKEGAVEGVSEEDEEVFSGQGADLI